VPRDGGIAVAERLHEADVRSLRGDDARQRDVDQERGDGEEEDRYEGSQRAQLLDLLHQIAIGQHAITPIGPARSVGQKKIVQRVLGPLGIGVAAETEHGFVEGSVQVEGPRQGLAIHPDDPEPFRLREQLAWG